MPVKGAICSAMETKTRKPMKFLGIGIKPKVGDKVKVAVGFSSYLNEGVVSSVHEDYCWIDQFRQDGKYLRSFTASFCYAKFYYL